MDKSLTGINFKKLYKNKKFYKLTNKSETHNGFIYKNGINQTYKFKNDNEGIHFCEENKIWLWIWYNGNIMYYIREVIILDDSIIYIEDNCFKTNKFYLNEKSLIIENVNLIEIIKKKIKFNIYKLYKIDQSIHT